MSDFALYLSFGTCYQVILSSDVLLAFKNKIFQYCHASAMWENKEEVSIFGVGALYLRLLIYNISDKYFYT